MKKLSALAIAAALGFMGSISHDSLAAGGMNLQNEPAVYQTNITEAQVFNPTVIVEMLEQMCDSFSQVVFSGRQGTLFPVCIKQNVQDSECSNIEQGSSETETMTDHRPQTGIGQAAESTDKQPEADSLAGTEEKPDTNSNKLPNCNKPVFGLVIPNTGKPDTDSSKPDTNTGKPDTDSSNTDTNDSSIAEQITALVNAERSKAGLSPVTLDTSLTSAANVRAKESAVSFSHTRPDGRSFSSILTDNGISYRGSGENLAYGQFSPESVMEGWMNSSGHRANILNPNFTKIGVGYYKSSSGTKYWSQLFIY